MFRLIVTHTDGRQFEYFAEGDTVLIGRAPMVNDISIEDPSISRQHVKLKQKNDGILVTDLESQNGVLINGKAHTKKEISSGQAITLGNVSLEILLQNQPIRLERVQKGTSRQGEVWLRPVDEAVSPQHLSQDTLTEADNFKASPKKK